MLLIDSHCHPDLLDYQTLHAGVDEMMHKAKISDVGFILAVATTLEGFVATAALMKDRRDVAFSCGVHPLNLEGGLDEERFLLLAQEPYVVALGETGLDYHYPGTDRMQQQTAFRQHIHLGRKLNKPVIVHSRDAREDTLAILREEQAGDCGAVLHCFTENKAMATALLDAGFYISFSGIITFRNAGELCDVVRHVPLDRLLIETDSPYLAPAPHRGRENQPAYVREVAHCIAQLKGVSLETLARETSTNFCRLFQLDLPALSCIGT